MRVPLIPLALAAALLALRGTGQAPPAPGTTPADSTPNPQPPVISATAPTPSGNEPPGTIYKQAMHPLDVVRQSLDNWSDAELAALHLGMKMAYDACDKMDPDEYTGDDLYELAHLCAFGQDWNPANTAAQRYLRSKAPEHRAQAYAISVGAFVHLNAIDLALATTREMLEREPYDAEVAYTLRYMKDFLEAAGNPEALNLAGEEHPKIIDALSKGAPLKAAYGDAVVSTGLLYDMAMQAAFFERYAGNDAQAAGYVSDIEKALPQDAALTADDRQAIDSARLQYQLLGTELAPIPVIRSFKSVTAKNAAAQTKIGTDFGAATVFVLFPDWCAQCRKMVPEMTQFGVANTDTPIRTHGLVFTQAGETPPPDAQKELLGTDVLEVAENTARLFGATDYPLAIVVDHAGVIRFIGVLPSDAFKSDGYMQKVVTRIVGTRIKPPHLLPASSGIASRQAP